MFSKNFPKVIRIEPAASCNYQCIHCPTGVDAKVKGVMNSKTFNIVKTNIINNIENIDVIVLYHGGEPLLNNSFLNMIKFFSNVEKELYIKTVTNGLLLTKKTSKEIVLSGLSHIEISLDGISALESEIIRVSSSTELVIQNIKELLSCIKENKSCLKVSIATTQFIDKLDDASQMDKLKYDLISKEFKKEINNGELDIKSTYAYAWSDMQIDKSKFQIIEDTNSSCSNYCDHIENTITIRANGDIVPCCYDLTSQLIMGNIQNDTLNNIWNNDKYLKLRKSISNKEYISICDNCSAVKPNKYLKKLF
jgi:radical SAM protein with 4Fe4S-binding SPASM domain